VKNKRKRKRRQLNVVAKLAASGAGGSLGAAHAGMQLMHFARPLKYQRNGGAAAHRSGSKRSGEKKISNAGKS